MMGDEDANWDTFLKFANNINREILLVMIKLSFVVRY